MTKYLLEFHSAKPTREALKMAIAAGSFELIKMMRERLPEASEAELRDRVSMMEVAAEFHQDQVLRWLYRDATVFDRELMGVLALEWKLADSLMVALGNGFRPWWSCTRGLALKWRASSHLAFVLAPEGFSSEGGWWAAVSGALSPLHALGRETAGPPARRGSEVKGRTGASVSAIDGEWTPAMSQALLGERAEVKSVVFPAGVTAIGEKAVEEFGVLESVVFPAGCTNFGKYAFYHCVNLEAVSLPTGCKATGVYAFCCCCALATVTLPMGCTTISEGSFYECTSLANVWFPTGCTLIGNDALSRSGLKRVVVPGGCEIGKSAFDSCRSLTTVTVGAGCTTIERSAFRGCAALVTVTLPSTLKVIGRHAFYGCPLLTTVEIPKGCQVQKDGFKWSNTRVTRL
jgi:hypothetical protein